MRIMIDADLLLESLLNRSKFQQNSKDLWYVLANKEFQGFICSYGLAKIKAVIGERKDNKIAELVAIKIQSIVSVCPIEPSLFNQARSSEIKDIESAIEIACALDLHLSAIITQIPHNFPTTRIPIYTVDNLLKEKRDRQYSNQRNQTVKYLKNLLHKTDSKILYDGSHTEYPESYLIPKNKILKQDSEEATQKNKKEEAVVKEIEILPQPISKKSQKPLWKRYSNNNEELKLSDAYACSDEYIEILTAPPFTD